MNQNYSFNLKEDFLEFLEDCEDKNITWLNGEPAKAYNLDEGVPTLVCVFNDKYIIWTDSCFINTTADYKEESLEELMKMHLKYYVLNYDVNNRRVCRFNVFRNSRVFEDVLIQLKLYQEYRDFDKLLKNVIDSVKWQEWSRREYEISVGDAFTRNLDSLEKWDAFAQFEDNAEFFLRGFLSKFEL